MSKRRFRRQKLPVEPVFLDITSVSHEGRGVAHREGKVAFVDGALPGESVSAIWVRKRSSYDEFRTVEIENPSEQRVEPICQFTQQCGGCSLQHWQADNQVAFKQEVLLELLEKTGGVARDDFSLLPPILGKQQGYRRKARLGVRLVEKKGGVLVGFREKYSSFITEMDNCSVLIPEVARLIQPLRELIGRLEGRKTIPQIEVAAGDVSLQEIDSNKVALIFRHLEPLCTTDFNALVEFAEAQAIELYLQPGGMDTVAKIYPETGESRLAYFLPDFDLQLNFHPTDFTQINASINRDIVSRAVDKLQIQSTDTVLDLFCGLGNFTLALARHCESVIGVEGSEEMVKRGYENAAFNSVENADFFAANLMNSMQEKTWFSKHYDKILLDPPRSGAAEIIDEVASLKASRIVYVSCNPATLARDAASLTKHGYSLVEAGIMDMFPHTTHVESMAVFELR